MGVLRPSDVILGRESDVGMTTARFAVLAKRGITLGIGMRAGRLRDKTIARANGLSAGCGTG